MLSSTIHGAKEPVGPGAVGAGFGQSRCGKRQSFAGLRESKMKEFREVTRGSTENTLMKHHDLQRGFLGQLQWLPGFPGDCGG